MDNLTNDTNALGSSRRLNSFRGSTPMFSPEISQLEGLIPGVSNCLNKFDNLND